MADLCRMNLEAGRGMVRCGEPAVSRAWLANCAGCLHKYDLPECTGHPVCPEHEAVLRAGDAVDLDERLDPAHLVRPVLARICSLGVPDAT